jgi:hypothetical protein
MRSRYFGAIAVGGLLASLAPGWIAAQAWATPVTLTVAQDGTGRFATIGAAADFANLHPLDFHEIVVAAGLYLNDFIAVTTPMAIVAAGGPVTIEATVPLPTKNGRLTTTAGLKIQGLTLTGAAIDNRDGGNGAAIRDLIGTGTAPADGTLEVRDSIITGNQSGILTGGSKNHEHVIIHNTKFLDNGNSNDNNGQEHSLYVNDAAQVDITDSLFCGQIDQGHNIKLRSLVSNITNVQSYEGTLGPGCTRAGNASRGIDISNGGVVTMAGVDLFQGGATGNSSMMEFGAEGLKYAANSLTITDSSFTSTSGGIGLQWFGHANPCTLSAVTFAGVTTPQTPAGSCTVGDGGGGGDGGGDGGGGDGGGGPTELPEPGSFGLLAMMVAGMIATGLLTPKPR